MGQFKPMVKMMTTEPTVELKLKKGGAVSMKKGGSTTAAKKMQKGGIMGALIKGATSGASALKNQARPGPSAPLETLESGLARPSMADRQKSMGGMRSSMGRMADMGARGMPSRNMGALGRMAAMGRKEGGETSSMHKAEMKKMSGTAAELKQHKSMPASKAHKGLATGGVALGQGGFKKGGKAMKYAAGGIIKSTTGETKMVTATPDHSPAKTGGVKLGNGGGYKTGGVAKSNAGGYKTGGASKKFARGGSVNDSGKAEAMPQGRKKPSAPVSINALSGTFKSGGKVTPAERKLIAANKSENASAMKSAKSVTMDRYSKYQKSGMKMADGGDAQARKNAEAREAFDVDERKFNEGLRSDVEDAMTYPIRKGKELFDKVKGSKFVKEAGEFADEYGDLYMKGLGLRSQNAPGPRAVTKTKESVTVSKKRGGGAC
jgi:hypothetical protein